MLIGRFELPTSPLPRVRSTNWAISAHLGAGSGNRTRIISLEGWGNSHYTMPASWNSATWFSFCTEYREKLSLFEPVSELIVSGYAIAWPKLVVGEGFEPSKSVTADLQSAPFGRSGTPPDLMVPTTGIELVTYWLQVSCSTYWAKSACCKQVRRIIWKILCLTSFFYEKCVFFNYSSNLQAKSHILALKLTSFNKKRWSQLIYRVYFVQFFHSRYKAPWKLPNNSRPFCTLVVSNGPN